jgi:hypothetical protein
MHKAVLALIAFGCLAVTGAHGQDLEAWADFELYSSFVWRGQVLNPEPVLQPALSVSVAGLSFSVWGNLDLTDSNDLEGELNEIDLTLAYARELGRCELEAGFVEYLYPVADGGSTSDVYLAVGLPGLLLEPRLSLFHDVGPVGGLYALLELAWSRQLATRSELELGLSAGWASARYNRAIFGHDGAALNDGNVFASLTCDLGESFTLSSTVAYTWLLDSAIEAGARASLPEVERLWGGIGLSASF